MKLLRVMETFSTHIDGSPRVYSEGMIVKADDPAVKGRDRFFMDAQKFAEQEAGLTSETATAAPNERRSIRDALKRSASRAQKVAEAANRTGADDGEADPESGSNQVPGVNRKDGSEDPDEPTAEQKRKKEAVLKVAREVNRTGADDGMPDPESDDNQVSGVNRKDAEDAERDSDPQNEDKKTPKDVQELAEEVNRTGADDGQVDPESGSNQVPGVNRLDPNDPDLPEDEEPATKKEPTGKPAKKPANRPAKKG